MEPIEVKREIIRYGNGLAERVEDSIVTEHPVTIKINGTEFATIVCSPDFIEDLVIGFLASEGVIRKYEDLETIWIEEKSGTAHVKTKKINPYYLTFQGKRYITSCCGAGRQGYVFINDALTAKKMDQVRVTISSQECFSLMKDMQESSQVFQNTGGVHNAALCQSDKVIISRMDIGRHNALDKIYGHCLKNSIPLSDKVLAFSGRISAEILLKASKIGCEIVLSKSAPTELALKLAEDLGITTIGFVRDESLNVYTGQERVFLD
ncbi:MULTISPECIES: formate dehydrogenase accessory sulfurtransferase FdhD [Mesobacillus]|uniref:Sulfur carrier protein FdhD n=2 Tax=Mesobacillus TaxID=2675231 RepID=A0A0D6ZC01_9BACI|nr:MULTISPECIES: formate dehydrogenase accessory sulfurtransferase FdhD [Mesobacillus]KIY22790.1 formate dehydrogenase [Mesobacillus subterraneus]MDQ0413245.1 FdhD protein [Mesobacillus stamsii]